LDHRPAPPPEERIDPAAAAQALGVATGGLGTLLIGAAQAKQAFGSKPAPPPPPTKE
jgi:hypothetical protein